MGAMPKLEVTATSANVKKIDEKTYGITSREGWVRLKLGDQEYTTKKVIGDNGLDPIWEETFTFDVNSVADDKLMCSFFLGDVQIGLTGDYILTGLVKQKLTYKGMAVPGGKVDLMLRALDFGPEEQAEE